MKTENTIIDKANHWMRNSVTLKLISVGILILLLLIPTTMIKSIIHEREALNQQATEEVSAKWANNQTLCGPVLTIPLIVEEKKEEKTVEVTRYWQILPENLKVNGKAVPKKLNRGIYEVIVYQSNLAFKGDFELDQKAAALNAKTVLWDKAFLTLGITDLRGIENEIKVSWANQTLEVEPGSRIPELIYSGVTVNLPPLEEFGEGSMQFAFDLNLQGSNNLSFVPVGSVTEIKLTSPWDSPSFNGAFLPDHREVSQAGFEANWKVLQLNRNYPQTWLGDHHSRTLQASAFGVDLISSLDDYQKSMRSAKYAVMTLALTFLIFFLVEILNGRKIHPFQYTLVGLALCLFYVLLVSITEHTSFNLAYVISSAVVVGMITLYSISIFRTRKLSLLLLVILAGIYGFLFVTLQMADYALLMGSIGLVIILSLTMYFTRQVNWYKLNLAREE